MFAPGLCAMLIAAVAVSVGVVPVLPPDFASASSVVHALDAGPVEFTQLARMLARVLMVVRGTVPLPAGVVASATPVESVSRFPAFANAFAIPDCASAVPELDTCTASVANPENAYAAATVDTSLIVMNCPDANVLPSEPVVPGQVPSAASSPAAEFGPDPVFPPTAYRYTCCPPVQV